MVNGRGSAHLSLMDVFANVVPGIVVLTFVVASVWPVPAGFDAGDVGVAELTALAALSMVVGLFLQSVALVEEAVVEAVTRRLQTADSRLVRSMYRESFARKLEALSRGPSTHFEERFWERCVDRFGLEDDFGRRGEYPQLQRTLLAHLESTPYSQAIRMRALYHLSRGLWSGFSVLSIYYLALVGFRDRFPTALTTDAVWMGVVWFVVLSAVFFGYQNMFHRLWFEYTVSEFYLDQTEREESNPGRNP